MYVCIYVYTYTQRARREGRGRRGHRDPQVLRVCQAKMVRTGPRVPRGPWDVTVLRGLTRMMGYLDYPEGLVSVGGQDLTGMCVCVCV